jgi:hypothetical protein
MMNWQVFLGAVGLTLATSAGALAQNSPASKVAPQKGWLTDFSAAKALSAKTGKPMFVVFRCDP